ncbi:MAG TPA: pyrroline-5-carboxylate reductase, partial [Burkholderiales bacterium]|nr:pyrroline-5-carboxylate reductase [Burkholderiales bacterium]
RYGVQASDAPRAVVGAAQVVVLAVKPQDMKAALAGLGPLEDRLVISVAAGLRTATLSRWLGGHQRLVRCMPNTPALIGCGISALYAAPPVDADGRASAEAILRAVGEVVWVDDERLLDPVTALSGSGPAYVFWFIEHLAAAGRALGLDEAVAQRLALHTVLGAAQLAAQSGQAPAELRRNVTSKGGTTEAALKVFEEEQLAERLARALEAASRRGAALGDELGRD